MSSKRRANSDVAAPASKKRRQSIHGEKPSSETKETAEGTTATGSKLLDSLRKSQDKTGRLVATEFLQLPPRTNKNYYERIKLPLSFQEIQAKLDAHQYQNMTGLESDLKRLIQNAKDFNATSSKIYEDAERIRKALSNFMPKHNPAYNDKDYRAAPTPLPQDGSSDEASQQNTADVLAKTAPEPSASFDLKGPADGLARQDDDQNMENSTSSPEVSMREEQLKIVGELIELRDPDDPETEITLEFYEKPPRRSYPDYYRQIAHPTALKDIQKAVSANKLSTWEAFITEVEFLWENARSYNEEGSFIHENANKLRDWFLSRMSHIEGAKDILAPKKLKLKPPKQPLPQQQPPPTRIKLINSSRGTVPAGMIVDEEARRRQEAHVRTASQVQSAVSPDPAPVQVAARSAPKKESTPRLRSATPAQQKQVQPADLAPPTDDQAERTDVKPTEQTTKETSFQPEDERPKTASSISRRRTSSAVPAHRSTPGRSTPVPTIKQDTSGQVAEAPPARSAYQASSAFDRIVRDPGKGVADALYRGIRASTHPSLHHAHPLSMNFYPSATQSQYGQIMHLPSSHWCLRITAWPSEECFGRDQHRVVVSRDLNILDPEPSSDRTSFSYQVKLQPGSNMIAIDFLATINKKGQPAPIWPEERHDFERFVLTVNFVAQA